MKNLKIIIFAALCALTGITAYAMDAKKTTIPSTNYVLGPVLYVNQTWNDGLDSIYILKQYIRPQDSHPTDTPTGLICYHDICMKGIPTRYIRDFEIYDQNMRRQGIGTNCLQQFIEQAKREGIQRITLTSTNRAIPLYRRVGFISLLPANSMRLNLTHANPYKPLFDYTQIN